MKLNDLDLCELRQAVIEQTNAYDLVCERVASDKLDRLRSATAQLQETAPRLIDRDGARDVPRDLWGADAGREAEAGDDRGDMAGDGAIKMPGNGIRTRQAAPSAPLKANHRPERRQWLLRGFSAFAPADRAGSPARRGRANTARLAFAPDERREPCLPRMRGARSRCRRRAGARRL